MQNVEATIYSQFANSPAICTIIEGFNQAVDPSTNIDNWYDDIWNVQTAVGYGLDVWGRIVGVSRVLQVAAGGYLGFDEAQDSSLDVLDFGYGIFYSGAPTTSNFALTDDAFRTLIYAKALANITSGSITGINAILMLLFGSQGNAWVIDNGNMTMTYAFDFTISAVDAAILENSGVMPRPCGVQVSYAPGVLIIGQGIIGNNTLG